MSNLTKATVFVVFLNLFMLLASVSMYQINPETTFCYNSSNSYDASDTIFGEHIEGNLINGTLNTDMQNQLPGGQQQVDSGGTSIFTDVFNSILNWVRTTPGFSFIYDIAAAPYTMLTCAGVPNSVSLIISAAWYLLTLLLIVMFIRGSD